MATAQVPTFPPLDADAECDVCIVGGGMAGLNVAYTLARAGKHVIVLDDGPIGGGETGRTTAQSDVGNGRLLRRDREGAWA
jgi:NADPH-dependent 2,4-dienoyl-CoA reductase/sulfur reductase-like enzyme